MSVLLNKANRPAVSVPKTAKVIDAVNVMVENKVGAAIVMENGKPAGIFTERDVMTRVLHRKLDPATTPISEVMTSPIVPIDFRADPLEAIQLMREKHIRHLPVVDAEGKVVGMLSIRHLLAEEAESLRSQAIGLQNYAGYDGASG
jgi:CBS domain-containing protein